MTDIVERLRSCCVDGPPYMVAGREDACLALREAADEIERLRCTLAAQEEKLEFLRTELSHMDDELHELRRS